MLSAFHDARAEIPDTRALDLPLSIGRIGARRKRRHAARKSQVAARCFLLLFSIFGGNRTEKAATTTDKTFSLEAYSSLLSHQILTDAAAGADEALRETEPREGAVGCFKKERKGKGEKKQISTRAGHQQPSGRWPISKRASFDRWRNSLGDNSKKKKKHWLSFLSLVSQIGTHRRRRHETEQQQQCGGEEAEEQSQRFGEATAAAPPPSAPPPPPSQTSASSSASCPSSAA